MTWQPIKNAPKDETTVDLWLRFKKSKTKLMLGGFRLPDCWYCPDSKAWVWLNDFGEVETIEDAKHKITHWMPRPAPPEAPNA